jgi:hypothetical protein
LTQAEAAAAVEIDALERFVEVEARPCAAEKKITAALQTLPRIRAKGPLRRLIESATPDRDRLCQCHSLPFIPAND